MASENTRLCAAALLAISAGACVGLAMTVSTSMYSVAGIKPVTTSAMSTVPYAAPRTFAMGSFGALNQPQSAMAPIAQEARSGMVSSLVMVLGGFSAAAAAAAAFLKVRSSSPEQVSMLAASGKKVAAKSEARPLWYPTAEAPEWLDGSLPGDRGFDPLGLAKPTEFLQYDLDALDQNAEKNRAGRVIGRVAAQPDSVSTDALQPYSEVFGLQRFRECELIHGRWAMLAVLGCLVSEAVTGVAWQNAGLVEVTNGASYFGFSLPFSNNQVVWFEVLAMGAIEVFRNTELNPEKRCYPGGAFDPLGLTNKDEATTFRLKEAELKHGRLAMLAFLGFAAAALNTGLGATQSFGDWAVSTFN